MYFYPIALLTLALVLIDAGWTKRSIIQVINGQQSTRDTNASATNTATVTNGKLGNFPLATLAGGHYVNPFSGWKAGRTDQGVDLNTSPGTPLPAIGKSQYIGRIENWYAGQPFIWFKLLDGPLAGKYYYYSEQIKPVALTKGQIVQKGQVVAHYASAGTGVEGGWATATGQTLARATTGYTEGQATPAGINFRNFLGL